jgi:anti-anti-sigma regulatory factor
MQFPSQGVVPMKAQFDYFRVELVEDVTMVTPTVFDFLAQLANVEMKKELTTYVQQEKPMKVLVNFENIQRFSTEFIGNLLSMKKLLGPQAAIKLCAMQPLHREVFDMLKLTGTVFEIYDTKAEACKSF